MADVLTLAQVKAQIRILSEDEDNYLLDLINPAREWVENYTNRLLGERDVVQHFKSFSSLRIKAWPITPDAEPTINYVDLEGNAQTISDARLILGPGYADVLAPTGQSWPSTDNMVSVTVKAGIPANQVPACLKHAMLMLIAQWNEEREGAGADIPPAAKTLCNPYRVRMLV